MNRTQLSASPCFIPLKISMNLHRWPFIITFALVLLYYYLEKKFIISDRSYYFTDRRSKLQIIDNSLTFTLKANNTVVIKAKLDAQVSARTW